MRQDKPYTNKLILYGRIKRSPCEKHLMLIDGKAIWESDDILNDFENKDICITIELKGRHGKDKTT